MSRRIQMPVQVETDPHGEPVAFTWRGVRRRVQVIARWHLRDRWWVSAAEADLTGRGYSDRHYFRVQMADLQVFDLYREGTSAGLWVLDRVLD